MATIATVRLSEREAAAPETMLTGREVRALLKVSSSTLARLRKEGRIRSTRLIGTSRWRYYAADVAQYQGDSDTACGLEREHLAKTRHMSEAERERRVRAAIARAGLGPRALPESFELPPEQRAALRREQGWRPSR